MTQEEMFRILAEAWRRDGEPMRSERGPTGDDEVEVPAK